MITLYGFGKGLGVYDPSPFVLKVAAFMRMADIDYQFAGNIRHLSSAPKKKLPYIDDNGTIVCDSSFIIEHLKQRYARDFDAHLTGQQQAIATLVGKSLDENLYWCLVYFRWVDVSGWSQVNAALFGKLPFPLKHIVPLVARRGVIKQLYNQGTGRHSKAEILAMTKQSLDAIALLIGDNRFCFGERPCTLDANLYAFLAELIEVDVSSEANQLAQTYPSLIAYCERIQTQYF